MVLSPIIRFLHEFQNLLELVFTFLRVFLLYRRQDFSVLLLCSSDEKEFDKHQPMDGAKCSWGRISFHHRQSIDHYLGRGEQSGQHPP